MLANFLRFQGEGMSGFCPQWVYSSCIGLVIKDFIEKDIPLEQIMELDEYCGRIPPQVYINQALKQNDGTADT